ncbi:MAG: AarF/UbiB family protein [Candidatus Binataceae bacterium]|jgi:predicted unusual protein kinase regulating ubiquinone biosynthesis (AarF/ABC1/UbiB family)
MGENLALMAERKKLTSGRARRAIRIGGLASQIGSSYLWTTLRKQFLSADAGQRELLDVHIRNARRIVEGSKELRGAFMKLIQMLSMRRDILPDEALEVLKLTQSNVPPMDYKMIAEQVRRELGKKPEQLFASFEQHAFAAASLGQVHRARLRSGEEVAVKIQYPGVEETVEQDLRNLKLLLQTIRAIAHDVMRQKIETRSIFEELAERLNEELDYVHEARNLAIFDRLLADDPETMVPRVIPDLSSRRVLTMTYLDGYPLADVLAPGVDRELKDWVARKYYTLVWRQILEFGVLHTDPHPGNYLVTYHPRLGILDFGSIRRFSEPVRRAHVKLARALLDDDDRAMGEAMVALGYLDDDQDPEPMVRVLHILFEPIQADRAFDPSGYDSLGKATQVGEITLTHKLYKSPAHSVFLLRALIGLEGIIQQLGCVTNYREIFRRCVERAEG